jgi:hypothetical protein
MSSFHGILPIIQPASGATLSAYTYMQVYVGTGGGSAIINGTSMALDAGSNFDIMINSISSVTGAVYLLGVPINVMRGTSIIGGYYGPVA